MERTDVKNNHTEEYSTGQIRCIEKSDPEYPQIMKQYSSCLLYTSDAADDLQPV